MQLDKLFLAPLFATICMVCQINGMYQPVDGMNNTVLHTITDQEQARSLLQSIENPIEQKKFLNAKNDLGYTALHWAVQRNDKKIVELLLLYTADPNIQNDLGWTPLHVAAYWGHLELFVLLARHNAKTDIANINGQVPGDLLRARLEAEAKLKQLTHHTIAVASTASKWQTRKKK